MPRPYERFAGPRFRRGTHSRTARRSGAEPSACRFDCSGKRGNAKLGGSGMTTIAQPAVAPPAAREPQPRDLASGLDLARIRADFPILAERINGKPLIYLDNGATSQKPQVVLDAIANYYSHMNANIHRGVHTLSVRATEAHDAARQTVRRFLNAADTREIIFVRGATEAINLVAQSYGRTHIGAGDEVLITAMEHHSNIVPWQILCEEKGAHLKVAPIDDRGELLLDEFDQSIALPT